MVGSAYNNKGGMLVFMRQKRLLALLDAVGGKIGNLDFQKLLFLYCQETAAPPPYEFVPYRFGAFSFSCYADRRRLSETGFLKPESQLWELTPLGRKTSRDDVALRDEARTWSARHMERGDSLVAATYRAYPYYGIRSEIAGKVLKGDALALQRIEASRPNKAAPGLWTIGYEGRSLEAYLNELIGAGIEILCDVRRNPISRKYGFSKKTLASACEGVGIEYRHLPELGITSDRRQELHVQGDYDALFAEYKLSQLPFQGAALNVIGDWIDGGKAVALTCYERLPEKCHRHCVAEAVEKLSIMEIPTIHL